MHDDDRAILVALAAATAALEAEPDPPHGYGYGIRRADLDERREHGPAFRASDVFDGSAAGRKRCQRGLDRLEAAGLVTRWRKWGDDGRVTNVKLTEAGRIAAGHLAEPYLPNCVCSGPPPEGSDPDASAGRTLAVDRTEGEG